MNETTATKNVAEILRAAAARVREGWRQDEYIDDTGRVCAIGAIADVSGVDVMRDRFDLRRIETGAAVTHLIRALCLSGDAPVPHWNDALGQTAENVAAGFEYAALIYEQEQALVARARRIADGEVQEAGASESAVLLTGKP